MGEENYDWDFGDGNTSTETNPVNNYQSPANYLVTLIAENEFGCSDTASEYIEPEMENGLYVPNALINGEGGEVGLFLPKGRGLANYECSIYDAWGNLLWQSNKLEEGRPVEGWDGRFQGQIVPQGAYVWFITATFLDGKIWQGSAIGDADKRNIGSVTVLR